MPLVQRPNRAARHRHGEGPARPSDVVRFALLYLLLVLVFAAMVQLDHVILEDVCVMGLTRSVAQVIAACVTLFGNPAAVTGDVVSLDGRSVRIVRDCIGLDVLALYCAGVLAFPSPIQRRLVGLAVGVPILIALNLVRLVSLVYVAAWFGSVLDVAHVWVWPLIMLVASMILWLSWARRVIHSTDLFA
jgi:exosortase H (IPTLxxWG-CTERM-specific)